MPIELHHLTDLATLLDVAPEEPVTALITKAKKAVANQTRYLKLRGLSVNDFTALKLRCAGNPKTSFDAEVDRLPLR